MPINTNSQDETEQASTGQDSLGQNDPLWIDGPWPARLHCTSPYHKGPRWLLAMEFNQLRRSTSKKGLRSWCKTCQRISMRKENMSRDAYKKQVKRTREVKAKQRRKTGTPKRRLREPHFRADRLLAYLERFLVETSQNGPGRAPVRLNGIPLSPSHDRFVSALRNHEVEFCTLSRVDALATAHQLPLWEIEEAAAGYKRDKRSIKRGDERVSKARPPAPESSR